jgi:hypothetical protein
MQSHKITRGSQEPVIAHLAFKSSPLKLLNQIKANLAGMVLGWSPFNIVSDSPALHSKWLLLLKIEISLVAPKDHFNSNF